MPVILAWPEEKQKFRLDLGPVRPKSDIENSAWARSSPKDNLKFQPGPCPANFLCDLLIFDLMISFLTLSNKVEKCLCIRFVCLSVCPSVCPRSHRYSPNVLKLIYVIFIWHCMNRIENGMHTTNGLSTETHKSIPIHNDLWGEKIQSVF